MGFNDFAKCPGINQNRFAIPREVSCRKCGASVEIWTDEAHRTCHTCGSTVCNREMLPKVRIEVSSK